MAATSAGNVRSRPAGGNSLGARLSTETKHALKTTEFWAMAAVVAGF
jgi:hypothetical protein